MDENNARASESTTSYRILHKESDPLPVYAKNDKGSNIDSRNTMKKSQSNLSTKRHLASASFTNNQRDNEKKESKLTSEEEFRQLLSNSASYFSTNGIFFCVA